MGTKVLALIGDDDLRNDLESRMERKTSTNVLLEIMLQFAYPRLDIAVSKGMNHLLKAPFVIHPKTGRVCVPFNPAKADKFNPEEVPTVLQLVEEIDSFTKMHDADELKNVKAYKKTSMKDPVGIFEEFLSNLSATWRGKLMEKSDNKMEF